MREHLPWVCALGLIACGGGGGGDDVPDAGGVTTAECDYVPVAPTANASGTVTADTLTAGAADVVLDVPVGTSLGGYTGRAHAQGGQSPDGRDRRISEGFEPSYGVQLAPRAKAVALSAGGETVVLVKIDAIFVYEAMLYDLEDRLGAEFHGKVLLASSHSHSAWMQFTGHDVLQVGGGEQRGLVYDRMLDGAVAAAQAAIDGMRPARIGIITRSDFDLDDQVNRDRRGENDALPGGDVGDTHLALIRIDGTDDAPIAVVPIFGEHGTLLDEVNPLASSDAPGAVERSLEDLIGGGVVVMHLQSAGADTSPVGHGGIDCNLAPGNPDDPCLPYASVEGHGLVAAQRLQTLWADAGAVATTDLALEMMTRTVEIGPYPDTFAIRGGDLAYAPFVAEREADGVVYDGTGAMVSPIDEFNAPVGAGLCESDQALFPVAEMPGTNGIVPYGSCVRLAEAAEVIGPLLDLDIVVSTTSPVCQTTRTAISALRLGDHVVGTLPGEVSVLVADLVRANSPVDADHTIVVGYAQGHVGYLLRPEDWLLGGYEPSITFWGPLEAEYLAEQLEALLPLATTPAREDGAADGAADRVATARHDDEFTVDTSPPEVGTVPSALPADLWMRAGAPASAQPDVFVPRVEGLARFVWVGDDPADQTPLVTIERETSPGVFAPLTRNGGQPIRDHDFLLMYTPDPLNDDGVPQRHLWAVEWQPVGDTLATRGGLALGNYRFHVEGHGWSLSSAPFGILPGGLIASASRSGSVLTATVYLSAPKGFRSLALEGDANRPVPFGSRAVTVELANIAGTLYSGPATTDAAGQLTLDNVNVPLATEVRVVDEFGNQSTTAL